MSGDRFWIPGERVWRNRHTKVLHFAPESAFGYTCCGIKVPAPRSETRRYEEWPEGYKPCGVCYPRGVLRGGVVTVMGGGSDRDAQTAANEERIIVVEYDGSFPLCWLWPGEQVGSAGDGTGACIIYRADGSEHRVNKGDLISRSRRTRTTMATNNDAAAQRYETEALRGAWARPLAARKLHFFHDGHMGALCGAYAVRQVKPSEFAEGTLAVEGVLHIERCPTCERKLGYYEDAQ